MGLRYTMKVKVFSMYLNTTRGGADSRREEGKGKEMEISSSAVSTCWQDI